MRMVNLDWKGNGIRKARSFQERFFFLVVSGGSNKSDAVPFIQDSGYNSREKETIMSNGNGLSDSQRATLKQEWADHWEERNSVLDSFRALEEQEKEIAAAKAALASRAAEVMQALCPIATTIANVKGPGLYEAPDGTRVKIRAFQERSGNTGSYFVDLFPEDLMPREKETTARGVVKAF